MSEFQNELKQLKVSDYQAGNLTPAGAQGQYPTGDTRLCVGFCIGFGGCAQCIGFCGGCAQCIGFCGGGGFCGGCARCGGFCGGCARCGGCGGCARCSGH